MAPWSKRHRRENPSFSFPRARPPCYRPSPMGQQYNKVIKRRRRRAYLERVKSRIKAARSSKKKTAKK